MALEKQLMLFALEGRIMKIIVIPIVILLIFCTTSYSRTLRITRISNAPDNLLGGMILKEIYKRANIPIILVDMPSKRALLQSSRGRADGELMRIYKIGRGYPTLLRVPTPFMYFEAAAFSKKYKFPVSGWSSLKR